jgi:hypothetical protein
MRTFFYVALLVATCCFATYSAHGAELQLPTTLVANTAFFISAGGSGAATLYLLGPGHVAKRQVQLGSEIKINPEEVRDAGRYLVILRSGDRNDTGAFYVVAAPPAALSFLDHPSRVPVAENDAISAVAFVLDKFHNVVLAPQTVNFRLTVKDAPPLLRPVTSRNGVAWALLNSSRKEGAAHFDATLGDIKVDRVVQQVASDPCNLRIKAQPTPKGVLVETDPVRDCSGNALPDGTIVSFTAIGPDGKSTVDAPIKRGVARTVIPVQHGATISVASGVVIGNELHVGGGGQ